MNHALVTTVCACAVLLTACASSKTTPVAPGAPSEPSATAASARLATPRTSPTRQCRKLADELDLDVQSKVSIVSDEGWAPYFACIVTSPGAKGASPIALFIVDGRNGKSVLTEEESPRAAQDGSWTRVSMKVTPFALAPQIIAMRITVQTTKGADDREHDKTVTHRIGRAHEGKFKTRIRLESTFEYGETTESTVEKIEATQRMHRGHFELLKTTTESAQAYGGDFDTKVTTTVERLRWDGDQYDYIDEPSKQRPADARPGTHRVSCRRQPAARIRLPAPSRLALSKRRREQQADGRS